MRRHPETGENQRDRMMWGLIPYWVKSELMKIWPISTRVNKPENDDEGILDPLEVKPDDSLL